MAGRSPPGHPGQGKKLEITLETITAARVTVQDFFLKYKKLAGMTGTASSDAREMRRIYKVNVVQSPAHQSHGPTRLEWTIGSSRTKPRSSRRWPTRSSEWNKHGVPVLVGTRSIEKSGKLSALARTPPRSMRHQILNAQESRDRGPRSVLLRKPASPEAALPSPRTWPAVEPTSKARRGRGGAEGGLHVIGTERHERAGSIASFPRAESASPR